MTSTVWNMDIPSILFGQIKQKVEVVEDVSGNCMIFLLFLFHVLNQNNLLMSFNSRFR